MDEIGAFKTLIHIWTLLSEVPVTLDTSVLSTLDCPLVKPPVILSADCCYALGPRYFEIISQNGI